MLKIATAADAAVIGEIHAASWKAAYAGIVPASYLDSLDSGHWTGPLSQWLASGDLTAWLLVEDEDTLGCVSVGKGRENGWQDWGEIISLYLNPLHFDRGKGALLLNQALKALKEDGFATVYLWVLEENKRARRFYEKHGFRPDGDAMEMEIAGKKLQEVRYTLQLAERGL